MDKTTVSVETALGWAAEAELELADLKDIQRAADRNQWANSGPGYADWLSGEIESLRSEAKDWRRAADEAARTGESRIVYGYIVVR